MELEPDYREFLELLNQYEVQYLIVGAFSVAYYGFPRYTGDMDVWVNPEPSNANKIISALKAFGFGQLDVEVEDLCKEDSVIQLGVEPVRIDILSSLTGLDNFDKAFERKKRFELKDGFTINYISYHDLLINKKATNRLQDKRDVQELEKIKKSTD